MKTSIRMLALVVAATASFNAAAADQFSAADQDLSNALANAATHPNQGTFDSVHNVYNRTKLAEHTTAAPTTTTTAPAASQPSQAELRAKFNAIKGERLTDANAQRTAMQTAALNEAYQAQQADLRAKFNAIKGERLVDANVQRTAVQTAALAEAQQIANYGVKFNSAGAPVNVVTASVMTAAKPTQTASINVAASALAIKAPQAPVSVTINGVQINTTAAALAAVAPETQVAVPHVAMLIQRAGNAGNGHAAHSGHVQGDNNGQSNAHNSAMGGRGMSSGHSPASNF